MPRVLVIEDDAALRLVAQTALAGAGFVVDTAENGAEGLSLAAEHAPDVIVLDSQMPTMNGVAFVRAYRKAAPRLAPIVAVSARDDVSLFAALVGAAAFVPKPYGVDDLVATDRKSTRLN